MAFEPTLDAIPAVSGLNGQPRKRPGKLHADTRSAFEYGRTMKRYLVHASGVCTRTFVCSRARASVSCASVVSRHRNSGYRRRADRSLDRCERFFRGVVLQQELEAEGSLHRLTDETAQVLVEQHGSLSWIGVTPCRSAKWLRRASQALSCPGRGHTGCEGCFHYL